MKEYCLNSKSNDINYELIGICIHNGGLNGGHYYAACKDVNTGIWKIHNDTHVTQTNIEAVKKENPYCLFYRKV